MIFDAKRKKSSARREEIIEAVLGLLGAFHLEALTTRRIAQELGLSQPALFRHFPSRGHLMEAVLESARGQLGQVGERALAEGGPPDACIEALVRGLLQHVQQHPGLPRLLFGHVSDSSEALQLGLRRLITLQVNLVSALVADGQAQGLFRPELDAPAAAAGLVGMVQGAILQWEVKGRQDNLRDAAGPLVSLWRYGAATDRSPPPEALPAPAPAPQLPAAVRTHGLLGLDVRPLLDRGEDPLAAILAQIEAMASPGVLELTVPFTPRPLIALLARRGHEVLVRSFDELCLVQVSIGAASVRDLSELEAPEPMVRVLSAAEALSPAATFIARLPRLPHPLLAELKMRKFAFEVHESPDGTALVRITRPA